MTRRIVLKLLNGTFQLGGSMDIDEHYQSLPAELSNEKLTCQFVKLAPTYVLYQEIEPIHVDTIDDTVQTT